MGTHFIEINRNSDGTEIVDHWHLCSATCRDEALRVLGVEPNDPAGLLPKGGSVSYGAHPGGCETDHDEWCVACGDFLWHGLECECENRDVDRGPSAVPIGRRLR